MTDTFLFIGVLLVAGLSVGCFFAIFKNNIDEMLKNLSSLLLLPFNYIRTHLLRFWKGVREFYKKQLSKDSEPDLQHTFYIIIGSTLYSLFFTAFTLSEYYLLRFSLAALGIDDPINTIPIGANSLTAIAIISSFLFWGSMLTDLAGITETTNWSKSIGLNWKITLYIITISCLILSIFVAASFGKFRGIAITQESNTAISQGQNGGFIDLSTGVERKMIGAPTQQKDKLHTNIIIFTSVSIPILVGIGGIFSSWGVVNFIKFTLLIAGFIVISPLGLVIILSDFICLAMSWIDQLVASVVGFIAEIGIKFLGLFGWEPDQDSQVKNARQDPLRSSSDDYEDNSNPTEMSKSGWDPFDE